MIVLNFGVPVNVLRLLKKKSFSVVPSMNETLTKH